MNGILVVPLAGLLTYTLVLLVAAVACGVVVTPFQLVRQLRAYASTGLEATADV